MLPYLLSRASVGAIPNAVPAIPCFGICYPVLSYLLSRAFLPAIPCFPTCYPVLPYLLSRASLPAIPCFPTCYPVL
ncbi:hypothetical protein PSW42_11735, partial [Yersinia pestis]|nr:hypothetical protein [Yersinia pestis]